MNYNPTKEDILWAKDVYDKVIWTQTLNPQAIREAFKRLFGYDAINAQQAKIKVSMYFTYQYKEDSVDTNLPLDSETLSVNNTNQSHQEDLTPSLSDIELISDTDNQDVSEKIKLLEADYENAVDANEKRSITQRINKLKKN